jgi:hypothetical protein
LIFRRTLRLPIHIHDLQIIPPGELGVTDAIDILNRAEGAGSGARDIQPQFVPILFVQSHDDYG